MRKQRPAWLGRDWWPRFRRWGIVLAGLVITDRLGIMPRVIPKGGVGSAAAREPGIYLLVGLTAAWALAAVVRRAWCRRRLEVNGRPE